MDHERVERSYEVGGKRFKLIAQRGPGGYIGRWVCDRCSRSGTSSILVASADLALVDAIRMLRPHAKSCNA